MIRDFLLLLENGMKTRPGEFLSCVPLLDQINKSEFSPRAYEWKSGGVTHHRPIDGSSTVVAQAVPDGTCLVVLQGHALHGPDNVVVVSPMNDVIHRMRNPYRSSEFFVADAKYYFDAINISGSKITLGIQVQHPHPAWPHEAMPTYEATYNLENWCLETLEWRSWA